MVFDLFCATLTTLCELILPIMVRYITNKATGNINSLTLQIILTIGAIYIVLRIIDAIANFYMQSVGHEMGAKIETDMRTDLFDHLQKLSFTYYDNAKIGQIMARITSDLFEVTEFAHHCPEEFYIAAIKFVVAFIVLFLINPILTLMIFVLIPIMLIVSLKLSKKMKDVFRESKNQVGELNSQVEDTLLGIRVVKSFANEDIEKQKFADSNFLFLKYKMKMYKIMAFFSSTVRMFDGMMYIVVVIAGGIFLTQNRINPADYIAYLMYVTTLLTTVRRIVEFTEQFQRGMTGIERFQEIMDVEPDITDNDDATELKDVSGSIEFRDVTFKYSSYEKVVLSDINLKINPGDNVALIGPSGGGKSTMCHLIPRFYDVTFGSILIDDQDVKNIKLKSLRANIGIVAQDVYMFCGTVFENIAYGKRGATYDEVKQAAIAAGANDFILQLPQGYNTNVGERGVKLSGGQKQRISIARVFLKNPPILILDEATSALDNENEKIIQDSLEKLSKGRTTFTIAHRLSTIKKASKILVLTQDGIVESGNHKELLAKKGIYYNLYNIHEAN